MAITISKRVRVAEGLIIAALILLLIYGVDATLGKGKTYFLPIDEFSRGMIFGAGAIALSIIAFIVSLKMKSNITSILLIINGILVLIGSMSTLLNNPSSTGYGVLATGVIILILGIVKILKKA